MYNMSDNYHLRRYYLENEEVPTQSMIRQKMSPNLADVFFKSLSPKYKVIAGLEPSLKGGRNDWYVCPKEVLKSSRAILKPLDNEHLTKINHKGVVQLGAKTLSAHHKVIDEEKNKMITESDDRGKEKIETEIHPHWQDCIEERKKKNTNYINNVFEVFAGMYRTSLNNIEAVFHEAAIQVIKQTQDDTRLKMHSRYETFSKSQAILLIDEMTTKLKKQKAELKAKFIEQLETSRSEMAKNFHDLNVDKHVAVEKLRKFLECQNLACQVYVSLKEKEECYKDIEESKRKHKKKVNVLTADSVFKDFEVCLAEQKERKQQKFISIWQKKVCKVVEKFQMFVTYCLNTLPEYVDFFINMEKLMLLQVNEVLENPIADSVIVPEYQPPTPQIKPFYLFCDTGKNAQVNQDLCPKANSSSTSQLPAIVINKRCLYAACDNFEQLTDKIKDYIHGNRGDDDDIKDDLIYEHFVPVKHTSPQQLLQMKLESSLLQVLEQEMANIKELPIECGVCKTPHCFCTSRTTEPGTSKKIEEKTPSLTPAYRNGRRITKTAQLGHQKEPQVENYIKYIEPKKCKCAKIAKQNLTEHLPVYMTKTSRYEPPELPNYEICSVSTLKKIVKKARRERTPPVIVKMPPKTRDTGTQYTDVGFELLCTCFSDNADLLLRDPLSEMFEQPRKEEAICLETVSPSYMERQPSAFAVDRANSLRQLINNAPDLIEIFSKNNQC